MTKEEFGKLKETVAYFGHWYDVIGEERVSILEKSIKYIADLENKIADIKANCDLAIEGRDIKIKELEQENAELKETLKTYNGCGDWDNDFHTCRVYLQHEELQMYINQLTKATDLLKKFIETSNPIYFDEDRQKVKVDAEQFIKEIEK